MKKKLFLVIMGLLLMLPFTSVEAATKVKVHVFYGEGCGYCHRLLNFLDTLKMDPNYNYMFEIEKYETWYSTDNKMLGEKVAEELNVRFSGVPFYVIGDRSIAGYLSTEHDEKIKANIKYAYENDIRDVVEYVRSGNTVSTTRKPTTTTTTRRTYNTTYKGTTTNGWGSVGDNTTTTRRIPITTTEETNYTTKPQYDSSKKPEKDKNGRLPEDIINEYFKRLNKIHPDPVHISRMENPS